MYNNDLSDSGVSTHEAALQLQTIAAGSLSGGIEVYGNNFNDTSYGVGLYNFSGLMISDGSVAGTHVNLTDGGSLSTVGTHTLNTTTARALYLSNVDDSTVDSLDLSWAQNSNRTGIGLQSNSSDNLTVRNLQASTRRTGISFSGGKDARVHNNDLSDRGAGIHEMALMLNSVGEDALVGGVEIFGNNFTTAGQGVGFSNMSDLVISNGSVAGTNVNLTDGGGLSTVGNHTLTTVSGTALAFRRNVDDSIVSGLDLSWAYRDQVGRSGTGLWVHTIGGSNPQSNNNTYEFLTITGRNDGAYLIYSPDGTVSCSTFQGNTDGIEAHSASPGLEVHNNHIEGNATGIRWNTNSVVLNAENNYWGAADGPVTDGGSGDSYINNVDASPFLAAVPSCAPTLPAPGTPPRSFRPRRRPSR